MKIALTKDGQRVSAKPEVVAFCQNCGEEVVAKCGEINIWHFAHKTTNDCFGGEGESLWHEYWKGMFPEECREFLRYDKYLEYKIADVAYCEIVLEYQTNLPDVDEIEFRQEFWQDLGYKFKWVIKNNDQFFKHLKKISVEDVYNVYKFKRPIKKFAYLNTPFYIDLENGFLIKIFKVIVENYGTYIHGKWIKRDNIITEEDFICQN